VSIAENGHKHFLEDGEWAGYQWAYRRRMDLGDSLVMVIFVMTHINFQVKSSKQHGALRLFERNAFEIGGDFDLNGVPYPGSGCAFMTKTHVLEEEVKWTLSLALMQSLTLMPFGLVGS